MRFSELEPLFGILRYLAFFPIAFFVWQLQCVLPVGLGFLSSSAIPSGWLVLVLITAAFEFPDERAVLLGIFCGLLLDVSNHGEFAMGLHMCSYGLAGFLIGTQSRIIDQIPIQFFLALSMTFLLLTVDYLYVQWMLHHSFLHTSLKVWNRILTSSAFNAIVVLVVFPFARWAWQQNFLQQILKRSRRSNSYVA